MKEEYVGTPQSVETANQASGKESVEDRVGEAFREAAALAGLVTRAFAKSYRNHPPERRRPAESRQGRRLVLYRGDNAK